jgi:hypothetical protein
MNLRVCFSFILLLLAPALRAQLNVTLEIERTNYVSWEAIPATVSVTNNSGTDIVLGGPNNAPWLNFIITGDSGRPVTSLAPVEADAIMCRNGQTLQRRFNLLRHYHLTQTGAYVIKASAYFPDLQRWIQSRPLRVNISQLSRPKWEQSFALPAGHRMAGKYRRYQLFNYHDVDRTYVYVRVVDESTGLFIATYRLSSVVPDQPVQPAVDALQNLHILCVGGHQTWAYHTIDPDGKVARQELLKGNKGTPKLVTQPSGQVHVAGGITYDPLKPAAASATATDKIRRLTDRPPGVQLR